MLRAESLSKTFGSNNALNNLNLGVAGGEIVCMLGANGAGKTTTINLFLGFLDADSGRALVNGQDVKSDKTAARRRLGYVPEQVALYPSLSGLENLAYFMRLSGGDASDEQKLRSLLDKVGLAPGAASQPVQNYSKGMRQKVGLAIALGKDAEALLLDEPLSGLDPKAANEFCSLLRVLASEGKAVLMATHDLFRARELSDKIVIMKSGNMVDALATDSLDNASLEKIYLQHMHDPESSVESGS
ncbi:MAG: ABC transporter ATP-binding protein [Gammaproteobacteria bacterium]|nr:ABC transporter ATP-binding protein [Gammaproteobacteria bacterium]